MPDSFSYTNQILNMKKQFVLGDESQSALTGIVSAYVVDTATDEAVDTFYWDPQSQEGWTHSGKKINADYGIEYLTAE